MGGKFSGFTPVRNCRIGAAKQLGNDPRSPEGVNHFVCGVKLDHVGMIVSEPLKRQASREINMNYA